MATVTFLVNQSYRSIAPVFPRREIIVCRHLSNEFETESSPVSW